MAEFKKEQLMRVGAVIIIALLGVIGYLVYANNQVKETVEQTEDAYSELEQIKAELDAEYTLALEQLESKKGENEQLNDIIEQQKAEIKSQKMRIDRMIRQGNANGSELKKAREQIQQLIAQRDNYLARIEELKADKKLLEEENVSLTSAKEELETTLTTVRERAAETESNLTAEKERLAAEKAKADAKVARGSVLNARNISVTPFKIRRSGKEVETKYADKAEKLNICFDLDKNAITPAGNNKVLIRILTPLGETLYVESQGSGEFANQSSGGGASRFTAAKNFTYNNKETNICVNWSVQTPLSKGNYTVEVFNKGYKTGTKTFTLK
jgi:myosin heavy subunit